MTKSEIESIYKIRQALAREQGKAQRDLEDARKKGLSEEVQDYFDIKENEFEDAGYQITQILNMITRYVR